MSKRRAGYIRLFNEGVLEDRVDKLMNMVGNCTLCPHDCKVDRFRSHTGKCLSGNLPFIASYGPHFGEEPPLVGFNGSGTIFFTNCNLKCIFCQNYDISQMGFGREIGYSDLADIMIELQIKGCHNINFVTPTHMVHAIVKALPEAIEKGLRIPLVYNSGGYDSSETIRLLEGIFDIYMPDIKYFNDKTAYRLSGIKNYVKNVKAAITEMYRQAGDLVMHENGIAVSGLIIRHLILPENQADTYKVIDFVHQLSHDSYLNLMDQFRPEFHACQDPLINRRLKKEEYLNAVKYAKEKGIYRLAG
jgi:putative pyruvate formate lyase activating enzyme